MSTPVEYSMENRILTCEEMPKNKAAAGGRCGRDGSLGGWGVGGGRRRMDFLFE